MNNENSQDLNFCLKQIVSFFYYETGKNSLKNKLEFLFTNIIPTTEGKILKLFDPYYPKTLQVNVKTIDLVLERINKDKKVSSCFSIDKFFELNEEIKNISGKDSRSKKITLLEKIFTNIDPELFYLIKDYYSRGLSLSLGSKVLIKKIIELNPLQEKEIKQLAQTYYPFQLFNIYLYALNPTRTKNPQQVFYKPMLAQSYSKTVVSETDLSNYYYEPKLDGIRILIKKEKDNFFFWSRNGSFYDKTVFMKTLTSLKKFLEEIPYDCVLDGQLWEKTLSPGEAFRRLSSIIKSKIPISTKDLNLEYTIFDVLSFKNNCVMHKGYSERRLVLENFRSYVCPQVKIITSTKFSSNKSLEDLILQAKELNLEGFVFKHQDAPYVPNQRSNQWLKVKVKDPTLEVLLTRPSLAQWGRHKKQKRYSSFVVEVKKGSSFVSLGKVGSGFPDKILDEILERFNNQEKIIVELKCTSLLKSTTNDSGFGLRFPRFVRFRDDLEGPNDLEVIKKLFNA